MVKLLRCIANVTQSNTEIKARFDDPLIIQANSKIALLNCKAQFPALEADGIFTITQGVNDTFKVDGYDTTIPAGTYFLVGGPSGLEDVLERVIALNCGTSDTGPLRFSGTDYRVSFSDYKFSLSKLSCPLSTAEFDDDWDLIAGTPTISDGNFAGEGIVFSSYAIPNSAFGMKATVQASSGVWDMGAYSDVPRYIIGTNVSNQYVFEFFGSGDQTFSEGTLAPTTTPQAGDVIEIYRIFENVTFSVRRGNTQILKDTRTVTYNQQGTFVNVSPKPYGYINSNDSVLDLEDIQFTLTEIGNDSLLRTITTNLSLQFDSQSLAHYLGFPGLGPYTESGDPAVINGLSNLNPDFQTAGILVTIDPLTLDSYDGDTRSINGKKGRDSILAVLNSTDNFGRNVNLDVNFPVALGIKNAKELNINQLSIRFKDQANGQVLQFAPNAVVTLLIYGPDEKP
jgi:hypothetical protein